MARLRIEEGIPLTMMMMKLPDWGKAYIISVSLKVLKQYRGAAKSIIPELKKIAAEPKKSAADREAIEKVIAIIELDNDPPKLVSIKDYLDQKTTPKSPAMPQKKLK